MSTGRIPAEDYPAHGIKLERRAKVNAKPGSPTLKKQRTGEHEMEVVMLLRVSTWGVAGRHDVRMGRTIAKLLYSAFGDKLSLTLISITGGRKSARGDSFIFKEIKTITHDPNQPNG